MHQNNREEFCCIACGQKLERGRTADNKEINFTCPKCNLTYLAHILDSEVEVEILSGKGDFEALLNQPAEKDGQTPMFCIFYHRRGGLGRLWKRDELVSPDETITTYYCSNQFCKKTYSITGH